MNLTCTWIRPPCRDASLIAALSAIATRVQRGRTTDAVLETAGRGVLDLGMRLGAFQLKEGALELRYIASAPSRLAAIEERIGRPLQGLRAPVASSQLFLQMMMERRTIYREDLDVFARFLQEATGYDASPLDAQPETAGVANGVVAPLFVREEPWGIVVVWSTALTQQDADAVSLFATHVASALENAESIEALERTNGELAACYADLARAQAELVKRERLAALGELAAVVAHEVRNPLGVLFNSIASLRRVLRAPPGEGALEEAEVVLSIVAEESDRLNRIVSELLQFSNPHEPQLQSCSVHEIIQDAVMASGTESVHVEVSGGLCPVDMDPRQMRQALLNVVLNGIQAMPKAGTLTIRAQPEEHNDQRYARIDVEDTGCGIPADVRSSMFEPFFTTKASGTGLGLAVVKRIIDAHHGEIDVRSGPGGTTFTVRLPMRDSATC
jgi:signal transduction histidine kinase